MFTAAATAGAAPVEYKFWRYTAGGGWTLARDYTSSNVYTWYPPEGSNAVQVWVRAVFIGQGMVKEVLGVLGDCARHKEFFHPL